MIKKTDPKMLLGGLIALIVLEFAAMSLISAVYVQRSDARPVRIFASWFPAARVGSHIVTYGKFLEARDAVKFYFASDAGKQAGAAGVTVDVEKGALDQLVRRSVLEDVAREKHVTLSNDDVQKQFDEIALQASSTMPDVGKYLQETFHWTKAQFQENVIRPELLQERLAATYASDTQQGAAALETDVQTRLTKPDVHIFLTFDAASAK